MAINNNSDLVAKSLKNFLLSRQEQDDIYTFISQNYDQFFEISERMVREIKNIKDKHPKNWKEMVAMTMFSTLQ